ncbi:MAG: acyl-CoA dehydrogenase family protein [Steroidobacteraceae bacterium]
MNFEYTESQLLLLDMLRRFLSNEYSFVIRDGISRSIEGYSREIWQKLASLGVIGALFSEADGGYGGTAFDIAVIFESLGRGLVLEPFLTTLLAGQVIAHGGDEKQRARLAQLMSGESIIAFAHDESSARYTLSHVQTRATQSDHGWVIRGVKAAVLHAESADCFLVSGRLHGEAEDESGICLFLVPATTPGIAVRGAPAIDGGRSAEVTFTDVHIPLEALVGAPGGGFASIERAIGAGVLALCAEALGAMEEAKAATLAYLRGRKQFDRPLGAFQALQHRMATLLLEIEQARSSVINAASALIADRARRERALSAAKYTVGRVGTLVAEESIQLHGAMGMTWEVPLSHYAKRLIMIDHQLGDEDFHLERFIEFGRGLPQIENMPERNKSNARIGE